MSPLNLEDSLKRAQERLDGATAPNRQRGDRGQSRLSPAVRAELELLLRGQDRPPVRALMETLRRRGAALGLRPPARATIYQAMARIPARSHAIAELPRAVRDCLYNLPEEGEVPGHQLAFYCLNYGGLQAISFAAGLPWLALYQAARVPGWRPRSRGLLEAILRVRGI